MGSQTTPASFEAATAVNYDGRTIRLVRNTSAPEAPNQR